MAKQPTKKDLEHEIEVLKKTISNRDAQINQIEIDYSNARHRYDGLLEDLSRALQPAEYVITSGVGIFGGTVNRDQLQNQSATVTFFRIGRLIAIEQEYKEMKDRFLPLPKQKILDQENNRNGA